MRIAVCGAHATGKTTLVSELARHLPGYSVVEEPYYSLTQEGHQFSVPPSGDDLAILLEASLSALADSTEEDVLFDRAPVDYLAYLAVSNNRSLRVDHLLPSVAEALASLALIVFVPIERPDRIGLAADEGVRLRREVDEVLRDMLIDDGWGFAPHVIEVEGPTEARVAKVLSAARSLTTHRRR